MSVSVGFDLWHDFLFPASVSIAFWIVVLVPLGFLMWKTLR